MPDVVTILDSGNAAIWCEGCEKMHLLYLQAGKPYENPVGHRLVWKFNGSLTHPTFGPSLLINGSTPEQRCHIVIEEGWVNYLADSYYAIKGSRRQLQPIPFLEHANFMTYADKLISKWKDVISDLPIPTWTEPWALAYCAEIASLSTNMVELGTYMGMSALVMLRANPSLHLWTVDHFKAFAFNREVAEHFLKSYIREGRCEIITGDSARAGEMLSHMAGHLDAVWVDDGHAVEDVKRDINAFLPLIKRGGTLFGHDWEGDNDVSRGVKALIPHNQIEVPVPRLWSYLKP